jgi:predicted metal-dependent hydrolase
MQIIEKPNIERYTTLPFPSFSYIPKLHIHPEKLSEKPHIPLLPELTEKFSVHSWKNCTNYLYAIDLFNYGYYWEAHEVLEKLWLSAGKKSPEGIFVQGIIQVSVAMLKWSQSNTTGLKRLTEKALPKLLSQDGIYLGMDSNNFIRQIKAFVAEEQKNPPLIILNFD